MHTHTSQTKSVTAEGQRTEERRQSKRASGILRNQQVSTRQMFQSGNFKNDGGGGRGWWTEAERKKLQSGRRKKKWGVGRGGRGKEPRSLTSVRAREDSKWLWNGSPAQSHDDRLFLSTTFVYFRHVHLRDGRPVTQQHSLQPASYSCKHSPVQFLYSTSAATLSRH